MNPNNSAYTSSRAGSRSGGGFYSGGGGGGYGSIDDSVGATQHRETRSAAQEMVDDPQFLEVIRDQAGMLDVMKDPEKLREYLGMNPEQFEGLMHRARRQGQNGWFVVAEEVGKKLNARILDTYKDLKTPKR